MNTFIATTYFLHDGSTLLHSAPGLNFRYINGFTLYPELTWICSCFDDFLCLTDFCQAHPKSKPQLSSADIALVWFLQPPKNFLEDYLNGSWLGHMQIMLSLGLSLAQISPRFCTLLSTLRNHIHCWFSRPLYKTMLFVSVPENCIDMTFLFFCV